MHAIESSWAIDFAKDTLPHPYGPYNNRFLRHDPNLFIPVIDYVKISYISLVNWLSNYYKPYNFLLKDY